MFNGWPVSPSISRASQRQQRPRTNQVKSPRRPALKYHSQKSAAQKVENDTRLGLILLTPFTNLPRATLELTPRHPQSYPESPSKLPRVTLEVTPRNPRSYSASPSKLLRATLEVTPRRPRSCSASLSKLPRATLEVTPRHPQSYPASLSKLLRAALEVAPRHSRSYPASPSKLPRVTLKVTPRHPRSYSAQPSKLLRATLEVAPTCPQICSGISHYQAFAGIFSHFTFSPSKQPIPSCDDFVTLSLCTWIPADTPGKNSTFQKNHSTKSKHLPS